MNIQLQVCGFIIVLVLFIIYKTHKSLNLRRNRIFAFVLVNAMAMLALDALSVVGIYFKDQLPLLVVEGICKLYLASGITFGFSALFYVLTGYISERRKVFSAAILGIIISIGILVLFFLDINIVVNGNFAYTEGPAVITCYIFCLSFIVATLFFAIFKVRKKDRERAIATIIWMAIWLLAAGIQAFHNELLLVGFAGTIGIVILYVTLESPEAMLDKSFSCFNSYAFDVFVQDKKVTRTSVSVLEIRVADKSLLSEQFFDSIKTPKKVISWIAQTNKSSYIFKNIDYSLFVVDEDIAKLRTLVEKFYKRFEKFYIENKMSITLIPNSEMFQNSLDLKNLLNYYRANKISNERLNVLSEVDVRNYRDEGIIAEEIKNALDEDRVVVYLQPIYNLATGNFDSAEALVRIIDDNGNIIPPGKFIPVSEKTGLITELGQRVLEKTCQLIKIEKVDKLGIKYIEINLSAVQFNNLNLADEILNTMKQYDVLPSQINFEITETGSVETEIMMIQTMNRLSEAGIKFSLDDFGKGQSNIGYLIDMPVNILKIDADMIKSYQFNSKARAAVDNVINLAHTLGCKVVAEGVETADHLDCFKNLGVDYIQGFYFSRALPTSKYIEFIKRNNDLKEILGGTLL